MFTVKALQTSVVIQRTLCLRWTVKWGVAIIYFFQNPCTAALEKGWKVRGYEKKNLHFVLAFFSAFNHLKNVVGKAFFKKFFQDIPLLEPVLSVSRQSRLCFLTHLSRLREWWILHLILEMCEKLAERIANLDGRKLSHFLSETIDYMLHRTLQSAVTWFQKPC